MAINKSASLSLIWLALGALLATTAYAISLGGRPAAETSAEHPLVLKLGHSLDQGHPVHLAMEFLAEALAQKSGGSMLLEIAPNGQLGSETDCIEYVQRGALAITKTSTAPLESFVPAMAVFSVPYAFRDEEHFWKVAEGEIGVELLDAGQGSGIRGLCYFDAGARSFYTTDRPIEKPSDLAGLKIRVQESKTAMDMVHTLGGSPTPMSFGELYSGLQQGIVDGAENNPPSFTSNRHYEVCKHYSLDEHSRTPDILLVSEIWWERLTDQQRAWLKASAQEAAMLQKKLWKEKTVESLATAQSHGVTIHRPEKTAFIEQVAAMHASLGESEVGRMLQRIRKVQ